MYVFHLTFSSQSHICLQEKIVVLVKLPHFNPLGPFFKRHMHAGGLTNIGSLDQTPFLALPAEFAVMCPTPVSKCLYRKLLLPWFPADSQQGMPIPLGEH
jgi:hypothetical protein